MTAETLPRPVLVGIDGTPSGREALSLGSALAVAADAPLVLGAVYGHESGMSNWGGPLWPTHQQAVSWLDDAADQLGELIPWRAVTTCASTIAQGLDRLATGEDAAVLVLGSSRRGPVGRWMVGSGAGRVVHGSPCAVAVVPHGWSIRAPEAPLTFGVALDDAPESREALAFAQRLAQAPRARLRILTAVPSVSPAHPMFAATGTSYSAWVRERRDCAEQLAQEAAAGIAGAEVAVLDGDPVHCLAEASSELDLLVVGSRRYGPIRATLLGSVSAGLVEQAHCPVLIVPRGVHAAQEAVPDGAAAHA
jgi:nucleotide-binding universal stress UspA family protein